MSLVAAFMSGFLLSFGLATGIGKFVWASLVFIPIAGLLRWCENREG